MAQAFRANEKHITKRQN